jgi:hypothetical protein
MWRSFRFITCNIIDVDGRSEAVLLSCDRVDQRELCVNVSVHIFQQSEVNMWVWSFWGKALQKGGRETLERQPVCLGEGTGQAILVWGEKDVVRDENSGPSADQKHLIHLISDQRLS